MNEKLTPEGVHSDPPPFFDVPGAEVNISILLYHLGASMARRSDRKETRSKYYYD